MLGQVGVLFVPLPPIQHSVFNCHFLNMIQLESNVLSQGQFHELSSGQKQAWDALWGHIGGPFQSSSLAFLLCKHGLLTGQN